MEDLPGPGGLKPRSGYLLCAAGVVSWAVALGALLLVLTDSAFASDFENGTHTSTVAAPAGTVALIGGVSGLVLLLAALWRGPAAARWISATLLALAALPLAVMVLR
ncbi:hypothetical protein BHQ15_00790 [Mycolicibacillus koreensis]|nr:hypothetical protein BHQ15_00790 [Mycolicibacillus koreensis]